jgi:hypothetical protein
MPVQYKDKTVKIKRVTDNPNEKPVIGWTNEETLHFMEKGYVVLRKFIPQEVIDMTMDVWKTIEHNEQVHDSVFILEEDIINESPPESLFKSHGAHTSPMGVMMHNYLTKRLSEVIDLTLKETYTYTRKYDRGAYLTAHTDRPSCEVSSTICLDYKSDDGSPWKIWVKNDDNYVQKEDGSAFDHQEIVDMSQSVPLRERKKDPSMKCITLEVGDLLLYQGPNVIHWRDTFVGDYSYHMFCHWFNEMGMLNEAPGAMTEVEPNMPTLRNVLAYDGRPTRYHTGNDQSEEFKRFSREWNKEKDKRKYSNNYYHIERAEK